ncbi:MAG: DNA methyltransferase [Dehalococcoidia bacterium]|jgi:site-specific DNA-methyltransferase (adenine-specific)
MIDIREGDCRELIESIPDNSVDLIFTDPPYLKEYLHLYEWLAKDAIKKLKPTGFLAMYVGCYHLISVVNLVNSYLDYFMELIIFGGGYGSMLWQRRVISRHKSILLFRPKDGTGMPRCNIVSVFSGSGSDKRFHAWGQDEASARYYIDCLTKQGDMVLDPFCGGGTTAAMCKVLARDCITFEVDLDTAKVARDRVINQQMPIDLSLLEQNGELF